MKTFLQMFLTVICFYGLLVALNASNPTPKYIRVTLFSLMKCSYGERGSLTATCVNATPAYFKSTPYRFDNLDETLRCVNCSLQTLDTGTFDLSGNQIRTLDLAKSLISTIQQRAFVGLVFLERLLLPYNNVKSIYPGTFTGVKKIKYIDLSHNAISMLSDDGFQELVNLQTLDLNHNQITIISSRAFFGLTNLHTLDLSNNNINGIKDIFANSTGLQVLYLNNNKVATFSGIEFENLTSLLSANFAFNVISAIPKHQFVTMKSLRQLDLSNNNISNLNIGSFQGLDSLEDLDLSRNNISDVQQKTLQNLHNLRKLNISSNKLQVFQTGLYSGLPQLRVLNLSRNFIEDVEVTGVFSLHSLHALDLSNNNITEIEYIPLVFRLPSINYLNLENNRLPCSLEKEMEQYFSEDNFKFILYHNTVGAVVCVEDNKTADKEKENHIIRQYRWRDESSGTNASTVWLFILITICIILIAVLFYLQYNINRELRYNSFRRTTSEVQLISSDLETRDADYLKD